MNIKLVKPKFLFNHYRKSNNNKDNQSNKRNNIQKEDNINHSKINQMISNYENNLNNTNQNSNYSRNKINQSQKSQKNNNSKYQKEYFHKNHYQIKNSNLNQQSQSLYHPPPSQFHSLNKQYHNSQNFHHQPIYQKKKSHSVSFPNQSYNRADYIQYLKKKNKSYLPPLKQQKPKLFFLKQQPVLSLQSVFPIKKNQINKYINNDNNRFKTESKPIKNNKMSRQSSCHSLKSCSDVQINAIKPTDKYISRLNNIKFVQRLLLIKPSNQLRRDTHQKFYAQHANLKKRISRMSNTSSVHKMKTKKQINSKRSKKAWN